MPDGFYSGCQKNVPVFKRFFLQPLIPQFRHSEHYYGKRYKTVVRSLVYTQMIFAKKERNDTFNHYPTPNKENKNGEIRRANSTRIRRLGRIFVKDKNRLAKLPIQPLVFINLIG